MTDNGFSDKLKGAGNKTKGEIKDEFGKATDNKKLQAEGKFDKAKGEVQEKVGETKDKFSNRDR